MVIEERGIILKGKWILLKKQMETSKKKDIEKEEDDLLINEEIEAKIDLQIKDQDHLIQEKKRRASNTNKAVKEIQQSQQQSTLGDIEGLSALKDDLDKGKK